MKQFWVVTAINLCWAAGLAAQEQFTLRFGPQQTETIGVSEGWALTVKDGVISQMPGGVAAASGRPFSATEVSKTLQTLSDGTEISNTDTRQLYRDILGRVRTESASPTGEATITIRDPVNGFVLYLSPELKTGTRTMLAGRGGRGGAVDFARLNTLRDVVISAPNVTISGGRRGARTEDPVKDEDLGLQNVNGVAALGKRTTQTIPVGAIGNNRDINIVNERWYSDDLQMLVKSVHSDPRFGVTTYELTNISRENPDQSLFQAPAGYTITEGAGRGRGGAMEPVPVKKLQKN